MTIPAVMGEIEQMEEYDDEPGTDRHFRILVNSLSDPADYLGK
jgi:hypothetical protein